LRNIRHLARLAKKASPMQHGPRSGGGSERHKRPSTPTNRKQIRHHTRQAGAPRQPSKLRFLFPLNTAPKRPEGKRVRPIGRTPRRPRLVHGPVFAGSIKQSRLFGRFRYSSLRGTAQISQLGRRLALDARPRRRRRTDRQRRADEHAPGKKKQIFAEPGQQFRARSTTTAGRTP
jgi:hypothetical protein